jgi:hypothetical protein
LFYFILKAIRKTIKILEKDTTRSKRFSKQNQNLLKDDSQESEIHGYFNLDTSATIRIHPLFRFTLSAGRR